MRLSHGRAKRISHAAFNWLKRADDAVWDVLPREPWQEVLNMIWTEDNPFGTAGHMEAMRFISTAVRLQLCTTDHMTTR